MYYNYVIQSMSNKDVLIIIIIANCRIGNKGNQWLLNMLAVMGMDGIKFKMYLLTNPNQLQYKSFTSWDSNTYYS